MQRDQLRKNHMDILWHEYTDAGGRTDLLQKQALLRKLLLSAEWVLCSCPVEPEHGE